MSYTWQNVLRVYKSCDNNDHFLKSYVSIKPGSDGILRNTDLRESTDQVAELTELYKKGQLITSRIGIVESSFLCKYVFNFPVVDHLKTTPETVDKWMRTNAGLYYTDPQRKIDVLDWWCRVTMDVIRNSIYTASYNFLNNDLCLLANMNMKGVFYNYGHLYKLILQNSEGQRLLYIGNAVDSVRTAYARGLGTVWKFPVSTFELDCIKTPQTTEGMEKPNETMIETCEALQKEIIAKKDFTTAILGCGAYGPPLINFIRTNLPGKNAIYLGSDCFKMFGITVPLWKWEGSPPCSNEVNHEHLMHVVEPLPEGCKNFSEKKYWNLNS